MRSALAILPGISSDDTTFASEGRWADGNNMRPWRGSMQTIGGWAFAVDDIDGVCRNVMPWNDLAGTTNVAFGTHSHLHVFVNGDLYDITPSSGYTAGAVDGAGGPGFGAGAYGEGEYGETSDSNYFPATWSLANWGEMLLACPRHQTIFLWENDTGTPAAAITNAPDNITYMLMSAERRQVLAFGCNEVSSGTFNPRCIRGSDLADYTNWTPSSTNSSFEYVLPGNGGRIVGARSLGTYIVVWTDDELWLGQFTGDASIYRWDRVAQHCGLAGPNAAQVINQKVFWVTPDFQFYFWSPGVEPSLVDCPIRNEFRGNIAQAQYDKIAATSVGQYGEVWFFYPDARDGTECSRYVALSTQGGQWFRGEMARSACVDGGPTEYPIFVTPEGTAYWHENGNSADGGVLDWHLTTADQYVEEGGRSVFVRSIYPDFEDQQGPISMALTLRSAPQSSVTYSKGPFTLLASQRKRDFRANARVMNARFSGSSAPAFARFGKPAFDVVIAGER